MRKLASLAAVVAVAGVIFAAPVEASCIPTSPAEQRARADIIFDGVTLEGPTATGVQRFRVLRYLKGRGPTVVRVSTGNIRRADGGAQHLSGRAVGRRSASAGRSRR